MGMQPTGRSDIIPTSSASGVGDQYEAGHGVTSEQTDLEGLNVSSTTQELNDQPSDANKTAVSDPKDGSATTDVSSQSAAADPTTTEPTGSTDQQSTSTVMPQAMSADDYAVYKSTLGSQDESMEQNPASAENAKSGAPEDTAKNIDSSTDTNPPAGNTEPTLSSTTEILLNK